MHSVQTRLGALPHPECFQTTPQSVNRKRDLFRDHHQHLMTTSCIQPPSTSLLSLLRGLAAPAQYLLSQRERLPILDLLKPKEVSLNRHSLSLHPLLSSLAVRVPSTHLITIPIQSLEAFQKKPCEGQGSQTLPQASGKKPVGPSWNPQAYPGWVQSHWIPKRCVSENLL